MKIFTILVFCTAIIGCTSLEFAPADVNASYPAKNTAQNIKVFRSEKPSQDYIEIGSLHYSGSSLNDAIKSFKAKTADAGGDAVIDIKVIPGGTIGTVVLFK